MSAILKANWNYPTTVWAGPGRIAELPAACALLGIKRPLLVTDEGLREAPMVEASSEMEEVQTDQYARFIQRSLIYDYVGSLDRKRPPSCCPPNPSVGSGLAAG